MTLKPPRDFWPFAFKVIVLHTLTYMLFGIIFFHVNDYASTFGVAEGAEHMRPTSSMWVYMGPLFQPFRGLLYAIALFPFRQRLLEMKRGWLALWGLLLVVGILSTSGPNPGSIEGMVYTKTSILDHIRYSAEVYLQTFLFALLLVRWDKTSEAAHGHHERSGGLLGDMLRSAVAGLGTMLGFMMTAGVVSATTGVSFEDLSHRPGAQELGFVMVALNMGMALYLGRRRARGAVSTRAVVAAAIGVNVLLPIVLGLVLPSGHSPAWTDVLNVIPAGILLLLIVALWRPAPVTAS